MFLSSHLPDVPQIRTLLCAFSFLKAPVRPVCFHFRPFVYIRSSRGRSAPVPPWTALNRHFFCSIMGFSATGLYHHAPGMRTIPGRQLDDYDTIFAVCREKHPERFYQPVRRMHTEPTPEFAGSLSLIPGEKQYLPQRPEMHWMLRSAPCLTGGHFTTGGLSC